MSAKPNPYRMAQPCARCPFRSDVTPYIRGDRAEEIARGLLQGGEFTCHQTTVEGEEDEAGMTNMEPGPKAAVCAGALITLEKQQAPNQMMRVAERIGMYDPTALKMDAPTYDSLDEWVTAVKDHERGGPADEDMEHCGVVGADCEDPAGYAVGGGAMGNTDEGTCGPDAPECLACGNRMCSACAENAVIEEDGLLVCEGCAG